MTLPKTKDPKPKLKKSKSFDLLFFNLGLIIHEYEHLLS